MAATAIVTLVVGAAILALGYVWINLHRKRDTNQVQDFSILDDDVSIGVEQRQNSTNHIEEKAPKTEASSVDEPAESDTDMLIGLSRQLLSLSDYEGARYYLEKASANEPLSEEHVKSVAVLKKELQPVNVAPTN